MATLPAAPQHKPPSPAGRESVEAALARLGRLHPKIIDLSLGRIARLLEALGRPQDRLPPIVHVAGTNGKGSTIAFLRAMAEAAGERVHTYTSPHLVRFNERIVLAGEIVDDERLRAAFAACERANGDAPITFFEVTTAAAFLLFAQTPADRLLLEVGLGGRFDATNVVEQPALSMITPVSYDHMEYLGDTLHAIAGEKAGILKPGRPAVIGPQPPEALARIEAEADKVGAPLTVWGRDFRAHGEHGRLVYEEAESLLWDLPLPALRGPHQIGNAAGAIAAARRIGLPEAAIAKGLTYAFIPARLQRITSGPLGAAAAKLGAELWLDGGHNPGGAEALAASISEEGVGRDRPLALITGLSPKKNADAFLHYFQGLAGLVIGVSFQAGPAGSAPAQAVAEAARRAGLPAQTAAGLLEAVHDACDALERPRILICGSLYLAGEALALGGDDGVQATAG